MSRLQAVGVLNSSPGGTAPGLAAERPPRGWGLPWAAGVAAVGVGVPLSLVLGVWVGGLSSNTVLAALPALLLVAVLPPLGVVGAEVWWGRRLAWGRMRVGRAVGVAMGLQVLMLVGAVWAGASARRLGDAVLLTLVEAVVLPAAVTGLMRR